MPTRLVEAKIEFTPGVVRNFFVKLSKRVESGTERGLEDFAKDVTETAQSMAMYKISPHIKYEVKKIDKTYNVSVYASLKDAPMAGAFEYGSGVHKKKNPRTYKIRPRNAPRLVFWWEREGRMFVGHKGQAVNHPGIAARPFLAPAMEEHFPHLSSYLMKGIIK